MNTFQKWGSALVVAGALTTNVHAGTIDEIDANLNQYPWYSQLAKTNPTPHTSYNTRSDVVVALTVV